MTPVSDEDLGLVTTTAREVVQEFVNGRRNKPALPGGKKGCVVNLLTRLMVNAPLLDAYCAALKAERKAQGPDVEMEMLGRDGLDIRERAIATDGFAALGDDELADLAIDPAGLAAVSAALLDAGPDLGPWFTDALFREQPTPPAESVRRAEALLRSLRDTGPLVGEQGRTTPPAVESRPGRRPRSLRLAAGGIAVAASVFGVGVAIGSLLRGGASLPEAVVASAKPTTVARRGADDPLPGVIVTSNVKGFAVVVLLDPGRPQRPEVYPDFTALDLAVTPDEPAHTGPLPSGAKNATVALVVVTPTPATGDIHKALQDKKYAADQIDELQAFIKSVLMSKNFTQVGFVQVVLPPVKNP